MGIRLQQGILKLLLLCAKTDQFQLEVEKYLENKKANSILSYFVFNHPWLARMGLQGLLPLKHPVLQGIE